MAKVRNVVGKVLVAVAMCSLSFAGCSSAPSPTAPTASLDAGSQGLTPVMRARGPVDAVSALRKGPDDRFVTCFPPDGSFLQISIVAMGGVNDAVQYCHKVLNGKSGGMVKAPPPVVP